MNSPTPNAPRLIGPSWLSALLPVTVETECATCEGAGCVSDPRWGGHPSAYPERDCERCQGTGEVQS